MIPELTPGHSRRYTPIIAYESLIRFFLNEDNVRYPPGGWYFPIDNRFLEKNMKNTTEVFYSHFYELSERKIITEKLLAHS